MYFVRQAMKESAFYYIIQCKQYSVFYLVLGTFFNWKLLLNEIQKALLFLGFLEEHKKSLKQFDMPTFFQMYIQLLLVHLQRLSYCFRKFLMLQKDLLQFVVSPHIPTPSLKQLPIIMCDLCRYFSGIMDVLFCTGLFHLAYYCHSDTGAPSVHVDLKLAM